MHRRKRGILPEESIGKFSPFSVFLVLLDQAKSTKRSSTAKSSGSSAIGRAEGLPCTDATE